MSSCGLSPVSSHYAFLGAEYSSSSESLSGSNSVSLSSILSRSNPLWGLRKLPRLNFFLDPLDLCCLQQLYWPEKYNKYNNCNGLKFYKFK